MLVLGSICACGCSIAPMDNAAAPPRRVLFVGNSYTFYNGGIPNALNKLSRGRLDCVPCVSGGKSLAWHYNQGNARQMIEAEKWDEVVLQDYSLQTLDKLDLFHLFTRRFDEMIDRKGARTVLFMTWPRKDRPQNGLKIYSAYEDAAKALDAKLAPVGLAWRASILQRPGLELYNADKSHPTPAGTYLAACVFYATLLNRSPVGLTSYVVDDNGKPVITLKPGDAKFLQEIAQDAVGVGKSGVGDLVKPLEKLAF